MAKVNFEFNDEKENSEIQLVVNRSKLISALWELNDFYRQLYNGKIYDPENIVYITMDDRIATEEDYNKALQEGHPLKGKGYYIRQEWLENKLDDILSDVRHLLD